MKSENRSGWLVALLLPGASSLAAQEPDTLAADSGVVSLAPIHAVGSILPLAGPALAAGVVGGRALGEGELKLRAPRLLTEALRGEVGASLYDDLGSDWKQTLFLRGFTVGPVVGLPQGVSVFLDGVPVNEPAAGEVNFELLPLEHAARVEIVPGTAPLLGPNSLAGVVNLVTRRGAERTRAFEASLGSGEAASVSAEIGGPAGDWAYLTGATFAREAGWRDETSARVGKLLVNVGRYGARSGAAAQVLLGESRVETAGSLPLPLYRANPVMNLTAGDFEHLRQVQLAFSGYRGIAAGTGSLRAYARAGDAERFNVNQVNDPDVRAFTEAYTLGADADWRIRRAGPAGTLDMRAGAGAAANRSTVEIHAERVNPGLTTHVSSPIRRLNGFLNLEYARGAFGAGAALRADRITIPFRNRLNPERDTTSTFAMLSPQARLGWRAGAGIELSAGVGRGFRAPALIEIACADSEAPCPLPFALGDDPPIDPVVVTTYELGAGWRGQDARMRVSAYRSSVRDEIFLFPYEDDGEPEGSTIDGYFDNVPRTRREGVEVELSARIARLSVWANAAYTRATFRTGGLEIFSIREAAGGENEVGRGDRIPLVPATTLAAGTVMDLGRVELGAIARRVGERFLRGDEANVEAPLPAYTVADARIAGAYRSWSVALRVRNVFDRDYATFGTFNVDQRTGNLERFLTPAQPRNVEFSVGREF